MTSDGAVSPELAEAEASAGKLRGNELTFIEVLFQALASAAPGLSVTLAVIVGASFAGGSLSLSLICALIGILLVASCIGQMAQRFPSAGGFYTYVSNGIHPAVGTMVSWLYLAIWAVFPSTLFLPFGNFIASTANADFGWAQTPVWIVCALICMALIYVIVSHGAKLSTNVSIVLGLLEFGILALISIWLIAKAGSRNTLSVFGTGFENAPGFAGSAGIIGAMVYAIYGFVGFENVVPLAEEAQNPRRNVPKAVILSTLILGGFIIFCTYAATVYFGPARFFEFPAFNGGDAWIGITKEIWHGGWYILLLALLNSCVASANGATNAGIRHIYAMGRIKLLPTQFAQVREATGVPQVALKAVLAFSVVATMVTGLVLEGPLQAFAFLGTIETAMAILLYALVALSCLSYFVRKRPEGFNVLLHVVIPILAFVVMLPTLMAAVGVGSSIFSFISPLPNPLNIAGFITLGWFIAGLVFTAYIWFNHPDRALATEQVFIDEPGPAADDPAAAIEGSPA
ncbi:MAG: APC family permease [Actinobacteria bacterium]|nr:APC family permease [Actinomycetota bacterium]